jgi:serine/threonine protein kinase/Flp pilus assembly protein TadD
MEGTAGTFAPGDRITNYEILGLAGAGGMGFVYKALDEKLERAVALKFLPPELTFSDKDRKRLLQEAKAASALDHPNIGVIHGIEETPDGRIFIVMAFYEGTTLSQRIRKGPISIAETVQVCHQIAVGLSEAHKHNIIHRDIKPSNIILTNQNVVKIVDFGLALILKDLSATRSLSAPGTPVYMAPEQIQLAPADRRSDIWALGVVLAEMLLGHHPFGGESWGAIVYRILNAPPDSLANFPQDLQVITYCALAKNPDRRYQGCPEFLSDLDRFRSQLQSLEVDPKAETLSTSALAAKGLQKYVHDASGSSKSTVGERSNTRRWLMGTVAVLAVLATVWLSPLRSWVLSRHLFGHQPEKAAYEAYLSAANHLQRYDRKGNLDLAISELKSTVERDPKFALGFAELGEAYRLKYQQDHDHKWLDEALTNCKSALALDSGVSAIYVTLGRIHNDSGNHDLAITEFQQALALDPRNAEALQGLAYAHESAGRISDAEAAFNRAVALRPDSWNSYNALGLFYYRQHRLPDAIAQLNRATELTPDNTLAYNNLAGAYLASARPEDLVLAEKALRRSIEISPTYPALANLGFLYIQQKRYLESAEMTKKALKLNDKDFLAWENLDWAYRWLGQDAKAAVARTKAVELLERAAQANPRDAQAQSHLAYHYGGKGLREEALTRVQAALALAPEDPDVLANVSATYEELGDHKQAVEYAQLSLQKGFTLADLLPDPDMRSVLADASFRAQATLTNR